MKKVRVGFWIATAMVWVGMFVSTHIPARQMPAMHVSDKLLHFFAYFGLGAMIYLSTWITNPARKWTGGMVVAIAMVYGAADEALQPFVNRHADVEDWMFDVAGAVCAVGLLVMIRWIVNLRGRRSVGGMAGKAA